MVHNDDRRYRVNAHEVEPVMADISEKLAELAEAREDPEGAVIRFMILYRWIHYTQGRPSYPEPVTWPMIDDLLREMDHYLAGAEPVTPPAGDEAPKIVSTNPTTEEAE